MVRPHLTIIWVSHKTILLGTTRGPIDRSIDILLVLYSQSTTKVTSEEYERGKKRQREEEVGSEHQRVGRAGVPQLPEGCGEQERMESWLQSRQWYPMDPYGLRECEEKT